VCQAGDAVVTSPVHSGTHAAEISATDSQTGECDQTLTLSPDTSYTLTGWTLVRYADVVAATCIGTETSPLLAGVVFDLAIVDEAGQISTPNLLVPLVRAKRSVLVGDHRQLPPFFDDEVQGWVEGLHRSSAADSVKGAQIEDLLRRSAFEQCYGSADADHRVMLTVQRRMPPEIAEFISKAYYHGLLRTEHCGGARGPLFSRPFAMIDTADRPDSQRREEPGRSEEWGARGYKNELEATLISQLVCASAASYRDWAVIVPYRAQVERVRQLITAALGNGTADHVGTVDAFQGGERDLVIFGCTRSNPRGQVGFLKELRRLNVAMTRARSQLVIVGDSTTLTRANDEPFADLMRSLLDYLRDNGEIRPSFQASARISSFATGRP
jgi:superfamily I DNA and/or RNA helicase